MLVAKKTTAICDSQQLQDLLGSYERPQNTSGVFLRSEKYVALGCDLVDTSTLDKLLTSEVEAPGSLILCIAEVSITYMDVEAADALIRWAAQFDDSMLQLMINGQICNLTVLTSTVRFCLLEQYLPDSAEHPFAQKMLQHFEKLQTPLKAIHVYPKLSDQERRFREAGWVSASARNLWDLVRIAHNSFPKALSILH